MSVPNALDAAISDRRVYIIDDLLGAILLLAAAALALLLDLTRRQICAVYQLAFALCGAGAFFIVGGLIDHHLSNDQLHVALYGSYLSSSLTTSYVYLPTLASVGISLALLFSLSTCACDCCCLAGAAAATHAACFGARIRANLSLYGACLLALYVAIGTRLNVRLRESAINPVGGTLHWTLLRAPFFLAIAHIGSLLLVALKLFLQHADHATHARSPERLAASALAPVTTVEDLMRPPPLKNFALAPPRRTSHEAAKQALPRSATPLKPNELRAAPPRATAVAATKASSSSSSASSTTTTTVAVPPRRVSTPNNNNRRAAPHHDGDVSSLISSDSDSDDGVLRPSFRAGKPPRHAAASFARKRPSGGSVASGYSSSPPPSPTHSTGSSSSTAFYRSRAGSSGSARPGSSSSTSSSSARPRPSSSGSSASTTFLSDADDHVLSQLEAYGSSGNESASLSDQRPSAGLRRRAPSLATATASKTSTTTAIATRRPAAQTLHHHEANNAPDWIECLDEASGSGYYYNPRTGESRWKDH